MIGHSRDQMRLVFGSYSALQQAIIGNVNVVNFEIQN
jgi:hypothetical protein